MRLLLLAGFAVLYAHTGFAFERVSFGAEPNLSNDAYLFESEDYTDQSLMENDYQNEFLSCIRATAAQLKVVNLGNAKAANFLDGCLRETGNSSWCQQLMRPNPASQAIFSCTYGASQPHQLINPDEGTWSDAYEAVRLVRDLESLGIRIDQIYNWWRPEPYNKNVGGAKARHPFGTSVDVRFSTLPDMERAHGILCQWRKQGKLRALGYYGSTGLHFGIGDSIPNTWGKSCN